MAAPPFGERVRLPWLGIRGRFLLAFLIVAALAIGTALVATRAQQQLGAELDDLSGSRVPAMTAAQDLSRQAERVSSLAPSLMSAPDRARHTAHSERLAREVSRLQALFTTVEGAVSDPSTSNDIAASMDRLVLDLTRLEAVSLEILELREIKAGKLDALATERVAADRLLTPGLMVLDAELGRVQGGGLSPKAATLLAELHGHEKARFEVSVLTDTLLRAAEAGPSDLPVMAFPLRRALDNLEVLAAGMKPPLQSRMLARARALRTLVEGDDGLPAIRAAELAEIEAARALLDSSAAASADLSVAIDNLVQASLQNIAVGRAAADTSRKTNLRLVIAATAATLVAVALIVWLYVGRGLVRQLSELGVSMRAIAAGDLDAPIPVRSGGDELGRMTEALQVFRDTAAEVQRSNLREISETRRQLSDAIESLADGFTLFDRSDRLVLHNSLFRNELFPGLKDMISPGVEYGKLLNEMVARKLVKLPEDGADAWLEGQMANHAAPDQPVFMELTDGRWLRVDERPTGDGGRVSIYTDITTSKHHEQALAQKSTELERLSSQLSRYLSPQVYEAIFSNPAAAQIASERKKLTVFFSDIAGFTETADRLQPEEVTSFINRYLAEMSRIAIAHGGTIDKYMGDGIMIFFGDPESRGESADALACVRMAIAMQNRIQELRQEWRDLGIENPPLVRMGIHSGFCTVGNFGSPDRMDYTIVGAGANAAARLEHAAEPGTVLISNPTYMLVRDEIFCEEIGEITVKGFAYPMRTYSVMLQDSKAGHFELDESHFHLELTPTGMSSLEKQKARRALQHGLSLLRNGDEKTNEQD